MNAPVFSVVTPSFNSSPWLKLCVASVADQGVTVEHIVQDPGSTDGTLEWAPQHPQINFFQEKDAGMYDAINKGLAKARGEIVAYLNCDEQYLPGTLRRVKAWFDQHPDVEVLFGDALLLNAEGELVAFRKSIIPLAAHTRVGNSLAILSCATFFRRSIIERGLIFDPNFRNVGDAEWLSRMLAARVKMGLLKEYTSAFFLTGENLSANPKFMAEARRFRESAPGWMRVVRPVVQLQHYARKFFRGAYHEGPLEYEVFLAPDSPRTRLGSNKPSFRWAAESTLDAE